MNSNCRSPEDDQGEDVSAESEGADGGDAHALHPEAQPPQHLWRERKDWETSTNGSWRLCTLTDWLHVHSSLELWLEGVARMSVTELWMVKVLTIPLLTGLMLQFTICPMKFDLPRSTWSYKCTKSDEQMEKENIYIMLSTCLCIRSWARDTCRCRPSSSRSPQASPR